MKPEVNPEKSQYATIDDSPPQRPKRNTCLKSLGTNNGLHWREETDLKRALYASLQESKRKNLDDVDELNGFEKEKPLEGSDPNAKVGDDGQEGSTRRTRVHAQRKFAQGSSPNSPIPTPLKVCYANNLTTDLLPCKRPKTEDFLTFLCLRGTTILPRSLDFLNTCSKSDISSDSRSHSPDLESYDMPPVKELSCSGVVEHREKNCARLDICENGSFRKSQNPKAILSRRRNHGVYETVVSSEERKSIYHGSNKPFKENPSARKRKLRAEDSEFLSTKGTSQGAIGGSSMSSMGALKEKYKQQRLAAKKKKPPPVKHTRASSQGVSKSLSTRSQTAMQNIKHSTKQTKSKIQGGKSSDIKTRQTVSHTEKVLAVEKRKSLRSANVEIYQPQFVLSHKDIHTHKRILLRNKKTPWLRKAKLVPPIVDVDSESESELTSLPPLSKKSAKLLSVKSICHGSVLASTASSPMLTRQAKTLSERTRSKVGIISKARTQINTKKISRDGPSVLYPAKRVPLLRNRSKAHSSLCMIKRKESMKKIKRSQTVLKTMSLRNDPEVSKRVTRSSNVSISDDIFWSKPEKKLQKIQNSKRLPKQNKQRSSQLESKRMMSKQFINDSTALKKGVKYFSKDSEDKKLSDLTMKNNKGLLKMSKAGKINKGNKNSNKTTVKYKKKHKYANLISNSEEKSKIMSSSDFEEEDNDLLHVDFSFSSDKSCDDSPKCQKQKLLDSGIQNKQDGTRKDISKAFVDIKKFLSGVVADSESLEQYDSLVNKTNFNDCIDIKSKLLWKDTSRELQGIVKDSSKDHQRENDKDTEADYKCSKSLKCSGDKDKLKTNNKDFEKENVKNSKKDINHEGTKFVKKDLEKEGQKCCKDDFEKECCKASKKNVEKSCFKKDEDVLSSMKKKDNEKDSSKGFKKDERESKKSHKSFDHENSKTKKKDGDKDLLKFKKDMDKEFKGKKEVDVKSIKTHDKEYVKIAKKEDKAISKSHKKDGESEWAKVVKKELEKELLKSSKKDSDKDSLKHIKRENCGSPKSSKKDSDKEILKIHRKDCDLNSYTSFTEKSALFKTPLSENKKDKSSKKDILTAFKSSKLSPKKKKKHELNRQLERISKSLMLSESDILSRFPHLKDLKIRGLEDKSELKKLISKSKKHKKLQLLKAKKLSKKLSSKLLNKYSKKKSLKSKKKLKLKKKEMKKDCLSQSDKAHSKTKKQKHKAKGDHHKKENQEKSKCGIVATVEIACKTDVKCVSTSSENGEQKHEEKNISSAMCTSTSNCVGTDAAVGTVSPDCTNDTATATSYIMENMSEGVASFDALAGDMAQTMPSDLVFGNAEEIQSLMTSEFSGVFDEAFTTGAILLTTRETLAQVPLHFIQELTPTKTMADAATNTCEEDLITTVNEIPARSEEMSVGTQTITPAGSPLANSETLTIASTIAMCSTKVSCAVEAALPKARSKPTQKLVLSGSTQTVSPAKKKKVVAVAKKCKNDDHSISDLEPFSENSPKMIDAPIYYPTLEEFQDPLEYICKIQPRAKKYGICKIVPPASFKPECKVNDDMRFTAHNQYVHKMLYRWGPNTQHVACIKKHLHSQGLQLEQAPLIGGIELDLSKFYYTVEQFGGLQQVIEKKKWQRVADAMHIPKAAQDRVTKLYDAYCKYLVSYATLPDEEKKRLEEEVISEHEEKTKQRQLQKETEKEEDVEDEEENHDCVTKGRSMSLSSFYRVARNTMSTWCKGKNDVPPDEVEHEFWKLVTDREHHVVVHAGNIDSSVYQSGFPCNRNSAFAKHPWNLKMLTNNANSILRCMGPVSGITIPTLHVGMLFTTGCWYRDPHSLPWIEYLHTGASKIWYGIPADWCENFRNAMKKIMPECCTSNPIWLPSDTAMVPPETLVKNGAALSRTVQSSGQFVVIFPESFTSTICSGYCVSESVYFAPSPWLDIAPKAFQDIRNSCEPPAFSLERLLISIANDTRIQPETLLKILPMIENIRSEELELRKQLSDFGLKIGERQPMLDLKDKKKRSRGIEDLSEHECEVCRTHCYISMVVNSQEDSIYCLQHAMQHIQKKNLKFCKLVYTYDELELDELVQRTNDLIATHLQKSGNRKKSPKKKLAMTPEK